MRVNIGFYFSLAVVHLQHKLYIKTGAVMCNITYWFALEVKNPELQITVRIMFSALSYYFPNKDFGVLTLPPYLRPNAILVNTTKFAFL